MAREARGEKCGGIASDASDTSDIPARSVPSRSKSDAEAAEAKPFRAQLKKSRRSMVATPAICREFEE